MVLQLVKKTFENISGFSKDVSDRDVYAMEYVFDDFHFSKLKLINHDKGKII